MAHLQITLEASGTALVPLLAADPEIRVYDVA
ncbi:hypothetical protein BDZ31_004139 [Conexibacter arvalis]|uniref:Uncharacterized protein n=1 Tax=Conexibacter arvalis TaxID=912552 RepID=A0A840IKR0_9ACTN|nr:hypothetical protein [Conexibacter arvalis]